MKRASYMVAIALLIAAVAVTGCGGGSNTTANDHPYALRGHHNPRPPNAPLRIKPAHMLPPNSAIYGGNTIGPQRNGWTAQDHHRYTVVYAGGQGYGHGDEGEFIVGRGGFGDQALRDRGVRKFDLIEVPGAGAIKITHAPLGRKVVTWAQKRGNLDFTSTNGVTGTLHLSDDTVTLNK